MALQPTPAPLQVAFNRFGFGMALSLPEADKAAIAKDPKGFLRSELQPGAVTINDGSLKTTAQLLQDLALIQAERKAARAGTPMAQQAGSEAMAMPDKPRSVYLSECLARFGKAYAAPSGFTERLAWFWANHFAVSVAKGQETLVTAGSFEREAIRPHVFGKFGDMLRAVEQHPAMLHYLDNRQSIGPNSRAGQRRNKGLNENLAREILELHTLGADTGYSQSDVTSFAKVITGWTSASAKQDAAKLLGEPGTFVFNANWHEPGVQKILSKTYDQTGVAQGETVLGDLARNTATAQHIAYKLARHFVADVPPPALVAKLAQSFTATGGDLQALTLALIEAPECWTQPLTKIRSPLEFIMAATRALLLPINDPRPALQALTSLGQPPWRPSGPNGFGDTNDVWASSEGLKVRLDVALLMAGLTHAPQSPSEILSAICGPSVSAETRQTVSRAESQKQGLALVLMSPEFQRR